MTPPLSPLRFALYSLAGLPLGYYIATPTTIPVPPPSATVGHHMMIVDRSGSMWGDPIEQARVMLEKVCTIAEYANSQTLVTLISYSSMGDMTVHFSRVTLAEAMRPGSACVESIRSLRATSMTCASQALEAALAFVRPNETTGINLHTDGWLNHPSPASEARAIDAFIAKLRVASKNVFVNTIAYGYADTSILMKLSNALSGTCVQARTSRDVYNALQDTTALLAGRTTPPVVVSLEGADYQTLISVSQRKINGTTADITIAGMGERDDATVYRYRKVSEAVWKDGDFGPGPSTVPLAGPRTMLPVYAFIRAKLAEGRLNEAKYALMGTRNTTLIQKHYKALTVEQRAVFALDVETLIVDDTNHSFSTFQDGYGLGSTKMSVLQLCTLLGECRSDFTVSLPGLWEGYQKRGLKRIPGSWVDATNPDGTTKKVLLEPLTRLDPIDDVNDVLVSAFTLNNTSANLQMRVVRDAALVETGTNSVIRSAAGKRLDPKEYRNYSLVGDGGVNAKTLPLRISSASLYAELVAGGVLPNHPYSPHSIHTIPLQDLPVVPYDMDFEPPAFLFEQLLGLTVQASILKALLPGGVRGEAWTEEQRAELTRLHLTSALNHSPPSTTPYTDLADAVSKGLVDYRTSVTIEPMNKHIAGCSVLYSANDYLARRYTVTVTAARGRKLAKSGCLDAPKLLDALEPGAVWAVKETKAKLDAIDDLMMPYFEGFFSDRGFFVGDMKITSKTDPKVLAAAKVIVDANLEALRARYRPLAFYIGATGLVPDSWGNVSAMSAEDLQQKYPKLFLAAAQKKSGTFFEVGEVIIAVYQKAVPFSTPLGVAAAKALMLEAYGMDGDVDDGDGEE